MLRKLLALALFAPATALADVVPDQVPLANGCTQYTLCAAETDTTAACDSASDNIVLNAGARYAFSVYTTQSTASAWVCNVYTSDRGYHATLKQALTSSGASTELTESQKVIAFSGVFDDLWIECGTITGGAVTATAIACPLTR